MARNRVVRGLRELALIGGMYGLYTLTRNLLGNDEALARRNGERIYELQRTLGIDVERGIQQTLDHSVLMQVLNAFYGIAHFAVTIAVMVWLFRHRSVGRYALWRTGIMVTSFVALIGYVSFPLMPPRLLRPDLFVDSLEVYGSPWSYGSGPISKISNQYAAMPSLHVGWALWCGIALWVESRRETRRARTWLRIGAVTHPALTILVVVATGNHFVLDAVGGAAVLAVGLAASKGVRSMRRRAAEERLALAPSEAVVAAVDGDHVGGVVAARRAGEVHGESAEVRAGTPAT